MSSDGGTIKHIFYIAGPAGCGKTTVAEAVRDKLGMTYLEADDFHPQENREKMGKGIPLTDADRKGWLEILSSNANRASQHGNVVVTCSALKKKYRTSLKDELPRDVAVHFVFLDASEEELVRRVTSRESTGHYMKADMIRSQLRDLEKPGGEERDAVTVNVERPLGEVVDDVVAVVRSLSAGDNSL